MIAPTLVPRDVRFERLASADPLSDRTLERELIHHWMIWDAWVDGRRRVDLHPLVLSGRAHAHAVDVAERAASLVRRAGQRAISDPVERARYKMPKDVERLAAAAHAAGDRGELVRVDLLLTDAGSFVACEVNADAPGGHNETLALPRLARIAGFHEGHDPTSVVPRLADRLVALSGGPSSPKGAIGLVYGTTWSEDLQVCAIVERAVRERGGRVVRLPPTGPKADDTGVSFGGEHLAVLYRYYPLEYMDGQSNVEALAVATERGELASLSSFSVIHAQSKLAMARAWAVEPDAALGVFPETFTADECERAALERDRADWVLKLDLSRVGEHVLVGGLCSDKDWGAALDAITKTRDIEVWLAQRFVRQRPIETAIGPRCLTLGVYVLDGSFCGYFARLSPVTHCAHDALVLPVFVEAA